jgi:hypothetical protein
MGAEGRVKWGQGRDTNSCDKSIRMRRRQAVAVWEILQTRTEQHAPSDRAGLSGTHAIRQVVHYNNDKT